MIYSGSAISVASVGDGIAELKLDLAGESVNKLNKATLQEFDAATRAIATDGGVQGVIVTSATLKGGGDWSDAESRSGAVHLPHGAGRFEAGSPFDYAARAQVLIVTDIKRGDLAALSGAYGRLIEAAGLKGRALGKAMVSEKHANFIVNTGDASAADVRELMGLCQREVRDRFGVELVPEVEMVGEW